MTFRIHFDWVEAAPCTDSLAQSTMAALTIEVKGAVVTSVLDRRTRSCRDHVVTPLGCVAQWLVGNWWRLFHEVADSRPRSDFAEAHDLACVGEGYLLPSLVIAPTPDKMSLHWRRQRPLHSAIEFTEQGEALVDRVALETEFGRLLDAVLDRLDNDDPTARLLCNEWNAIQAVDADEREFCRAAALLGRDPFATPQELAARIVDFWNRTAPPCARTPWQQQMDRTWHCWPIGWRTPRNAWTVSVVALGSHSTARCRGLRRKSSTDADTIWRAPPAPNCNQARYVTTSRRPGLRRFLALR